MDKLLIATSSIIINSSPDKIVGTSYQGVSSEEGECYTEEGL